MTVWPRRTCTEWASDGLATRPGAIRPRARLFRRWPGWFGSIPARPYHRDSRTPGRDPVDGLVGECVRGGVLGPRHVGGGPAIERAQDPTGLDVEGNQFRILDPPTTRELLDDQLRIEQQVNLARPELRGQGQGADDPSVLGDVVRLGAEILRDGGVGGCERVARIRPRSVDEYRPKGRRAGVAPRGAIRPDDEPRRRGQAAPPPVPLRGPALRWVDASAFGAACNTGNGVDCRAGAGRPRSFRHAAWSGS